MSEHQATSLSSGDAGRGAAILISYKEVAALNERMARIDSKLDLALTLPAKVEGLALKVAALETDKAVREAKGRWSGKAAEYLWAFGMTTIAAGVWLPVLKAALGSH